MEQFNWFMFAMMNRVSFTPTFFGREVHGCPCSDCANARANGKSPRDGHFCPCEACQKARKARGE